MKRYAFLVLLGCTLLATGIIKMAQQSVPHESWEQPTSPGPVAPVPKIKDHVAAQIYHDCETQRDLCLMREQQASCPTWNTFKALGVEITCAEHVGRYSLGRPKNWGNSTAMMPCSKIVAVKLADHIKIEGR